MFGIRLIVILAIVGGLIAYLGDWLGTKVGKGRLSLFGLRPKHTSILVAVFTGVSIAVFTIAIMAVSSQEARTALFGVKELQQQKAILEKEAHLQKSQLEEAQLGLKLKQSELQTAQGELGKIESNLKRITSELSKAESELSKSQNVVGTMRSEVQSLLVVREKLEVERKLMQNQVDYLGQTASKLEQNIGDLRSGNVLVRSGQVLKTSVFAGGQPIDVARRNLNKFMEESNRELTDEFKGMLGGTQGLLMTQEEFDRAVNYLATHEGIFAIRIQAKANLFAGEPLAVGLEIFPNQKIYTSGEVILVRKITIPTDSNEFEGVVINFLQEINEISVEKGVKPNPLTGTVGAMNISELSQIVESLKKHQGDVYLVAKARQSIYSPGPVRLDIFVEKIWNE